MILCLIFIGINKHQTRTQDPGPNGRVRDSPVMTGEQALAKSSGKLAKMQVCDPHPTFLIRVSEYGSHESAVEQALQVIMHPNQETVGITCEHWPPAVSNQTQTPCRGIQATRLTRGGPYLPSPWSFHVCLSYLPAVFSCLRSNSPRSSPSSMPSPPRLT